MEVRAFKLNNGEEVIAEVTKRSKGVTRIKNPVILHRTETGDIQMVGWFQMSGGNSEGNEQTNRNFPFKNDHIFLEEAPIEKIVEIYEQQFGAGIVKPTQKIITGVN